MKGLILKDLITTKKNLKVVIAIIVFYIVYSFAFKVNIISMISIVSIILTMSTFSYDEYNNWDKIAMSMPVSPKDVISAKFIITAVLSIAGGIISIICSFIYSFFGTSDFTESVLSTIGAVIASCLVCFISIPFFIKFGIERGKLICMICLAIAGASVYFVYKSNILSSDMPTYIIVTALIAAAVLITVLSYIISVKIYSDKEF